MRKIKKKFLKKKLKRIFWQLMLNTPAPLRKRIIRSRFEVNYDLDPKFKFKQAESIEEIDSALSLVYESYVDLNYIEKNVQNIHFTKYLGLPTTVILIIKYDQEVVGTMSIVSDSSLGLPCDTTWNLDQIREKGRIAEISALCIKKGLKTNKGHLLLPLCKTMYHFCTDLLKLEGIVIATTHEVEPFYTDLLLFSRANKTAKQKHSLVKGNESTCCYLLLGEKTRQRYKEIYKRKDQKKNLGYFFIDFECSNIILPKELDSFALMNQTKNENLIQIFREKPLKINNG